MHYYQFNIGDYKSHTSHLTLIEDIAYRRLLDMYYLHEKPLDNSIPAVARLIGMREYEDEVEMVLLEFFVCDMDIGGWVNKRADVNIAIYKGFSEAGKQGAAKRWSKGTDSPPIAPPIATNNHKPITNNHKDTKYIPPIPGELLSDWLAVRKAKRSGALTETAFKGLQREAAKAGLTDEQAVQVCCERSWQSFKAEWYIQKKNVQEARLDFMRQLGGNNGNEREIKELNPRPAIENNNEGIREISLRLRQSDGE